VKKVLAGFLARLRGYWPSMFTSSAVPARSRPMHELVEPRLLYSADVSPLVLDASTGSEPVLVSEQTLAQAIAQTKPTIELVVIDSRVSEPEVFLRDIAQQQAQGRSLILVEVNAQDNGLAIIASALQAAQDSGQEVSAVHIISHGRDGEFDLGNQTISQATLRTNAATFAQWANALSDDGDLLIYGCNFAQTEAGKDFAKALSALTGADVAANPEATGTQALGGDWALNFETGVIEAHSVASQSLQSSWQHLLIAPFASEELNAVNIGAVSANTGLSANTTFSSGGRNVGVAANGDYVVVWENATADVKFRRFNADGTAKDVNDRSLTTGSIYQSQASIAVANTGEFVIAWADYTLLGSGSIRTERFDLNGALVDNTLTIETLPSRPSVAFDENTKNFVVVWEAGGSTREIKAQSFSWSGNDLSGGSFRVNTSGGDDSRRPSVVAWGGRAMVVWEGSDSDAGGIKYRDFNLDGSNMRTEMRINSDQLYNQDAPDIAVAQGSGRFVVTWQVTGTATDDGTRIRGFDQNLNEYFSETSVTNDIAGDQNLPMVAVAYDGRFVIVQQDENITQDINGKAVTVVVFNADGTRNETYPETSLSYLDTDISSVSGDQFAPSVAWRGGQLVSAWTSNASGTNVVLSRRLDVSAVAGLTVGLPNSTQLVEGDPAKQISVQLNTAPTSNVVVSAVVSNAQGMLTNSILTFTPLNWATAQLVYVAAVNDLLVDADTQFSVNFTAISTDPTYQTLAPQSYLFTSINADIEHNIVVDTASDLNDGDTSSLTALFLNRGGDGKISLREAITAANNTVNLASGADSISFDIPLAAGVSPEIYLSTALPTITEAVIIDGTTQHNSVVSAEYITLVGSRDGVSARVPLLNYSGLVLGTDGGGSGIRGLAITGFNEHGVSVMSSNNAFKNNYIGFSPLNISLPKNQLGGIRFFSLTGAGVTNNLVEDNVISNNTVAGIQLDGADGNLIVGNRIGTNVAGNTAMANGGDGVLINTFASTTFGAVGNALSGNTIGGNVGSGVRITGINTTSNVVVGNFIGTNATGVILGNGLDGVSIQDGSSYNRVGGTAGVDGNVIANNGNNGILVTAPNPATSPSSSTSNNLFLANSISTNGQLGIDLAPFDTGSNTWIWGVTANDTGDVDIGPNGLVNFPELGVASNDGTRTIVTGQINAAANAYYRVELFSSTSADASGHGEAAVFIDAINVTTDAAGIGRFTFDGAASNLPIGTFVSATATQADSTFLPNGLLATSEFSNAQEVVEAPAFRTIDRRITINENSTPIIDAKVDLQNPSQTGLTFSIDSVAEGSFGSINPVTGELTFVAPPNYEAMLLEPSADNIWWIKVRASNGTSDTTIIYKFTVNDVNEAPSISLLSTINLQEDMPVTFSGANAITIADPDTKTNSGDTHIRVVVVANSGTNPTAGSFNYGAVGQSVSVTELVGSLWFEGKMSEINLALQSVTFTPDLNNTQDVTLKVTVDDFGSGIAGASSLTAVNQSSIEFTVANDAPVITGLGPTLSFIENQAALPIAPGLMLADVDSAMLTKASIHVASGYHNGLDTISLQNSFGLGASFDALTGTLWINGPASVATYEAALRTAVYSNAADVPRTDLRVAEFKVFDGIAWSAAQSVAIDVHAVNDAPSAATPTSFTMPYASTVTFASQGIFIVTDLDAENSLVQITLSVTDGNLALANAAGLTIVQGSVSNDVQLTYQGKLTDINAAFSNLTFTANLGFVGTALLGIQIDDLGNSGDGGAKTSPQYEIAMTVQAGIKPVLVNVGSGQTFTEGASPISLMPLVQLGGGNTNQIVRAEISAQSGFDAANDQLTWAPPPTGLTVSWDSPMGALFITGSGSFADYQTVLRSVRFENTSENPSTQNRMFEVRAFDGLQWSDPSNVTVIVNAVNDAPVLTTPTKYVIDEDSTLSFSSSNAWVVSDVDSSQVNLSIAVTRGTLQWNARLSIPPEIQGLGTSSIFIVGTASQVNAWSSNITFVPDADFFGTSNVQWTLIDTEVTSIKVTSTSAIDVNAVNDAPIANPGVALSVDQGKSVQLTAAQAQAIDIDNQSSELTYRLTALTTNGVLLRNGQTLLSNAQFTQADIDNGSIEYQHNGLVSNSDSFSYVVVDSAGLSTPIQTVKMNIALRPVVVVQGTTNTSTTTGTTATTSSSGAGDTLSDASGKGIDSKLNPSGGSVSDGTSASAVGAANVTQASTQRAASKSIGPSNSAFNSASDNSSAGGNNVATGQSRLTDSNRFADEKVKPAVKQDAARVFGEGVRLDNLTSLGFGKVRTAAEGAEYAQIVRSALSDRGFIDDVQKIGDDVKQTIKLDRNVVASTTAVSAGLSIGYVIWLVRGGALLSSLLASIPAWRVMDPLPILGSMGDDEQSDDESLDAMIDKANERKLAAAQQNKAPELALDAIK
jgi:Domain of unknown function (DUF4347)/Cadherin-like/Right handed beta helix region